MYIIQIISDGRRYAGTPLEIVHDMQHGSFNMAQDGSLSDYIAFTCRNLHDFFDVDLPVQGDNDAARAESFVREMISWGLAVPVSAPAFTQPPAYA